MVLVVGMPGTGKEDISKYFQELARQQSINVIAIRGSEEIEGVPLGFIRELFYQIVDPGQFRTSAQHQNKLSQWIVSVFGSSKLIAIRQDMMECLAEYLGVDLTGGENTEDSMNPNNFSKELLFEMGLVSESRRARQQAPDYIEDLDSPQNRHKLGEYVFAKVLPLLLQNKPTAIVLEATHFCDESSWNALYRIQKESTINLVFFCTMRTNGHVYQKHTVMRGSGSEKLSPKRTSPKGARYSSGAQRFHRLGEIASSMSNSANDNSRSSSYYSRPNSLQNNRSGYSTPAGTRKSSLSSYNVMPTSPKVPLTPGMIADRTPIPGYSANNKPSLSAPTAPTRAFSDKNIPILPLKNVIRDDDLWTPMIELPDSNKSNPPVNLVIDTSPPLIVAPNVQETEHNHRSLQSATKNLQTSSALQPWKEEEEKSDKIGFGLSRDSFNGSNKDSTRKAGSSKSSRSRKQKRSQSERPSVKARIARVFSTNGDATRKAKSARRATNNRYYFNLSDDGDDENDDGNDEDGESVEGSIRGGRGVSLRALFGRTWTRKRAESVGMEKITSNSRDEVERILKPGSSKESVLTDLKTILKEEFSPLAEDELNALSENFGVKMYVPPSLCALLQHPLTRLVGTRGMDELTVAALLEQNGLPTTDHMVNLVLMASSKSAFWCKEIVKFILEMGLEEVEKAFEGVDAVHVMITLRLEKLSQQEQLALRYASIIGDEFSEKMLAALIAVKKGTNTTKLLNGHLHVLQETGFILCKQESDSLDGVYQFQNSLIRTTISKMVPVTDAAEIHHNIAEYIEVTHGDNLRPMYQLLGFHYGMANNAEDKRLAFKYHLKGADQALARGAYTESLDLLELSFKLADNISELNVLHEVVEMAVYDVVEKSRTETMNERPRDEARESLNKRVTRRLSQLSKRSKGATEELQGFLNMRQRVEDSLERHYQLEKLVMKENSGKGSSIKTLLGPGSGKDWNSNEAFSHRPSLGWQPSYARSRRESLHSTGKLTRTRRASTVSTASAVAGAGAGCGCMCTIM